MGRPSKLTDKQWNEVEKRVLSGESVRKIAGEFKIAEGAIRQRVKTHTKPIKELANQMARVEAEFERLPLSTQVKVRTLADDLKGISQHLASAANYGAMTAHRLSAIAHVESSKIDDTAPLENIEALKGISALNKMANEAAGIGLNLIRANQDTVDRMNEIESVPPITHITRRIVRAAN